MALAGVKVIEFAGLAPVPFCGMILSDFGAKVIRVDRAHTINTDRLGRGKMSIAVDLKQAEGVKAVRKLCNSADVLIEPFRPGVMEKLGLGPKELLKDNPGLIYARLTGYGQTGQLSQRAGHDINYLAISGLLSRLGRANENPHPPINLLADFAGGGLICALGISMALFNRTKSGLGQVIDSNMVEGAAYVGSFINQMLTTPVFSANTGEGWLDGGAPFYGTYKTKDNKYMAVGAIEDKFYSHLLKGLGLDEEEYKQHPFWDKNHKKFTELFASKTRDEWCKIFDNVDACVTPVLSIQEASKYKHNDSKDTFEDCGEVDTRFVPNPAPRLTGTPAIINRNNMPIVGQHSIELLLELGYTAEECEKLKESGAIEQAQASHI